jgi:hypothetical protein
VTFCQHIYIGLYIMCSLYLCLVSSLEFVWAIRSLCAFCTHETLSDMADAGLLLRIVALLSLLLALSFPRRSARACTCTSFCARREPLLAGLSPPSGWNT